VIFTLALLPRALGPHEPPPFDDLYHLKRIAWSAAHSPHVLAFDPDRGFHGAWCPWPPLYDATLGAVARLFGMTSVLWLPAIGISLFAALLASFLTLRFGLLAGAAAGIVVALHPYLLPVSSAGAIDHHWTEPILVTAIVWAVACHQRKRRAGVASLVLAAALLTALFVQTALLVAAALAFVALFFGEGTPSSPSPRIPARGWWHVPSPRPSFHSGLPLSPFFERGEGTGGLRRVFFSEAPRAATVLRTPIAFALAALVVAVYRLGQPGGYPSNAWFLGWPHVAALSAAAVACFARMLAAKRIVALAAGALCLAPVIPTVLSGARFFGGDPWLDSINEFQPMFRDPAALGTDLANLGGGALFALVVARRHRIVGLFAIVYLFLSLTSHRFLVPAVPLFAVTGAIAIGEATSRRLALAAAALMVFPLLAYDLYVLREPWPNHDVTRAMAAAVRALPPGRVLAPWPLGHAIDVLGRHAVVIDNFGSMPDAATFDSASRALLSTSEDALVRWCRAHEARYVVFPGVERIASTAAGIGAPVDPRRTVWWRIMHGRAERFRIVRIQ